jgi:transposase
LDRRIVAFEEEFVSRAREDTAARRLISIPGIGVMNATALVGISKRGSKYLRKLLIHGARSVLPSLLTSATPLGRWLRGLMARAHKNTAVVALANKLARIAWAVLRHGGTFDASAVTAAA